MVGHGEAEAVSDPDFVIHHDFEESFMQVVPPRTGKFIAVRTWDFGPYPPAWATKINSECDQLWVHTQWIREQAIAGGVEADRIRVVPHGVDPEVYRATGPSFRLNRPDRFIFLFVGTTVYRKGIDILLKAYAEAFNSQDDVSLVIKDHSGDVFYQDISYRGQIEELQQDPSSPEIILIDDFLTEEVLAALYRRCDVAVFPYRAEGFAIPILEAMACGTPVVAPEFGACLDYVEPTCCHLLPARRVWLPVGKKLTFNTLGFEESIEEVDFCELPAETLAEHMRKLYSSPDREGGSECARRLESWVHDRFSWDAALDRITACLNELGDVVEG